jgi:type IV pilus assembly protein PilB
MSTGQPLILCIDDEKITRTLIERLLATNGYSVITAESGEQALQVLQHSKPELILLDVMMPGMNGYEVCARLRDQPDLALIPVIFVTALEAEKDKAKAFALGAADYLVKPIQRNVLLEKVAAHITTKARWQALSREVTSNRLGILPADFPQFKIFLADRLSPTAAQRQTITALTPSQLYTAASDLGLSESKMAQYIAEFLTLPYLPQLDPDAVALGIFPPPFCKTNQVVAIHETPTALAFVLSNPFNWELLDTLRRWQGSQQSLKLIVTEPQNITALFQARPPLERQVAVRQDAHLQEGRTPATVTDEPAEQSGPIIALVNQLIEHAYAMGASDIHIEPKEHEVVIRYRIDGHLRIVNRLPHPWLIRPLVSRLKIMSDLDIVERRLPQDGRITFTSSSRKGYNFDLRIATAPMHHGEKVVLRILDKQRAVLPLHELGFSVRNLALYREKIKTPYGMILHVGPTGSGKSMTLYAALNELQSPEINIQTIEDPIEYTLPDINQLQVNREIGLTFQRALRSFLRQDPDIILVGEMRDRETAQIAIEAALTGHLVLSTLHTNDAASTITRLTEMGIEPFLVSSSLILVCAQRLLRRLCPQCKEAYEPTEQEQQLVGVPPHTTVTLYRAKGCRACNGIGYKGRIGVHELLVLSDRMRKAISKGQATAEDLKRAAVEECGMTTLYWDAMEKVRAGICSLDDALSKIRKDDFASRPAWMLEQSQAEQHQNSGQSTTLIV